LVERPQIGAPLAIAAIVGLSETPLARKLSKGQADRYASRFPQSMKSIDQQLPPLDLSLIEQANNLNKIAQTRRAMNLR
jgi:hypothetical protein